MPQINLQISDQTKELSAKDLLEITQKDSLAIMGSDQKRKPAIKWKRFLAKMLDFLVFLIATLIFLFFGVVRFGDQFSADKITEINQICTSLEKFETVEICKIFVQRMEVLSLQTMIFGYAVLALYFIIWPQSLGKRIFKIEVLSQNNKSISILQRIVREILNLVMVFCLSLILLGFRIEEIINFVTVTMLFANGQILFSPNGFHDTIAKTKVVEKQNLPKN